MPGPLYDDEDCRKFGENLKKNRDPPLAATSRDLSDPAGPVLRVSAETWLACTAAPRLRSRPMTSAGPTAPLVPREPSRRPSIRHALLKALWVILGIVIGGAWLLIGLLMMLDLMVAFGNPPDTYTGQDGDRAGAWFYIAVFLFFTVLLLGYARLTVRRRRTRDRD